MTRMRKPMSKKFQIVPFLFACLLFLFICAIADAQERILRMDVRVRVEADASLTVTERIAFVAEHVEIRRGLIRDIPIVRRENGRRIAADFKVLSATMDGKTTHYATHRAGNNVEVHLGDDSYLARGRHEYVLAYRISDQLIFHDDADELYWNVTGNDWIFPIERATLHVDLPKGAIVVERDAATGVTGDKGSGWRLNRDGSFETTRALSRGEGFTVMVAWPKGFVSEPAKTGIDALIDRFGYDRLLGASAFFVFAWYALIWLVWGRDPKRGVVFPRWSPPDGLEPAYIGYVRRLKFGPDLLLADLIDLAVRGYLTLEPGERSLSLRKAGGMGETKGWENLSAPHRMLMEALFLPAASVNRPSTGTLTARRLGGDPSVVGAADAADTKKLLKRHPGFYKGAGRLKLVRWNRGAILAGLLSFGPLLILCGYTIDTNDLLSYLPFVVLTIFAGLFVKNMLHFIFHIIPRIRRTLRINRKGGRPQESRLAGFVVIFSVFLASIFLSHIGFVFYRAFGNLAPSGWLQEPFSLGCLAFAVASAVFFSWHMHARTAEGRALLDKVEGFEMYLKTAERHRLEKLYPASVRGFDLGQMPRQTPQLFERLLSYAFALGIAETWADAFTAVLEAADYNPEWQRGRSFNAHAFTGAMHGMESAMRPASKGGSSSSGGSSGRGGGTSSGGGRGGGGGRGR